MTMGDLVKRILGLLEEHIAPTRGFQISLAAGVWPLTLMPNSSQLGLSANAKYSLTVEDKDVYWALLPPNAPTPTAGQALAMRGKAGTTVFFQTDNSDEGAHLWVLVPGSPAGLAHFTLTAWTRGAKV